MSEISQTLRKAAQIIAIRGWAQGQNIAPGGRVCAAVALDIASLDPFLFNRIRTFLRSELLGDDTLMRFNDKECQSANDVIALFEIGADIAEGQ